MKRGTYVEKLPFKGELKVTNESWEISYYFSGPDLRYNGTFVSIPGNRVQNYVEAFRENWKEYCKLKESLPEGGEYRKIGKLNMTINIGSFCEGVCLRSYHMAISNEKTLNSVIESYEYAIERAPIIQEFLKSV